VVVAVLVLRFNVQKYAIIIITALGGTAAIVYTLLVSFGNLSPLEFILNPVTMALQNSFWWFLFFIVVAAAGIFIQIRDSKTYVIAEYNRYSE
jgi:hypothetical protein